MDKLKMGNPTPTDKLIYRMRLMVSAGGMLTRDRLKLITEAADRLQTYSERIAVMSEPAYDPLNTDPFEEDWR